MLTCPQCGTTTLTNPRLSLLYSSCCGLCLCTDCIHRLLSSPNVTASSSSSSTVPCPSCSSPLTAKDWDAQPLSTQRYTKEVKLRQRLNRIFVLQREDFSSEADYEDWQEWKADVLYDMTDGDKDDAKDAERRVEEWRKANQHRIDRALERQAEHSRRQQLRAEGKLLDDDDAIMTVAGGAAAPVVPVFQLPTASLKPSLLHELDAAIARMEDGEERARKKEERHAVWMRGRRSGGWVDDFAERRECEEMYEGWMIMS